MDKWRDEVSFWETLKPLLFDRTPGALWLPVVKDWSGQIEVNDGYNA